ncbi:glycoside hydrolase family 3 N-terminal domain-containing protein [Capillimicrobium parvum]|uniref:Beta-hexosaminidase n=1 Tax=Capillimicrobium parvum TaxID=2884022 RepID=A0A9E7C135_9ACTN|nr:glycoside hydrolase family 3 N-terminal domain-containing protein [Capillimicrobium parvum]UGS36254.1 Beta-hexosaminidase [Capillimicrobium parvum]
MALAVLAAAFIALVVSLASGNGSHEAAVGPQLTSRQLIGQRMVFGYDGTTPPAALERRIRRGEAAGVILFGRNVGSPARLRRTLAALQRIHQPEELRAPLLVLVDQEGGPVRRLPGAPELSAAATASAAQARAAGRGAGANLRSVGANVDLAPVVDVARAGSALEGERRTYSRDAARVRQLADAFARGLGDAGVAATYKHFPGFGAATVNTDDAPARIDKSLAEVRRVDLRPYEDPPEAVKLVMLSTAVYPARDPRPAAFSRRWATGELRDRLHFGGVSITDDLQTPAVRRFGNPGQLAYFAVRAGVDLPLFSQDYGTGDQAADGLVTALRAGRLDEAELRTSAARVLALRRSLAAG